MVADLDEGEKKLMGVVSEIGLERDENQFRFFNLKVGIVVRAGRSLNYEEGERMMRQFRKDLLGKEVEFNAIMCVCSVCGKGFNSEQGMKRHMRVAHEKKEKVKKKKSTQKEAEKKSPNRDKKKNRKTSKTKT